MMKNTIIKILFFLIFFLCLSWFCSISYTKYQKQKDLSINDVKNLPRLKTLIIGDSLCLRGIDPAAFDSAFNYASAGENIILSYYKFKNLLESRRDIETVILTSSLGYFGENKADYISRIYLWKEMIDFKELAQIKNKYFLYLYKFIESHCFSYKAMREEFFERYFAKVEEELPYYQGFKPKPNGYYFDITDTADKHFKGKKPFDESLWIYLNMFLELAKDHDIQVYMVRMPLSQRYSEKIMSHMRHPAKRSFASDVDTKKVGTMRSTSSVNEDKRGFCRKSIEDDTLPELSLKLTKIFPDFVFLDYLKIYWGQEEQMFFDDTHLNQQGALRLSQKIRLDIS